MQEGYPLQERLLLPWIDEPNLMSGLFQPLRPRWLGRQRVERNGHLEHSGQRGELPVDGPVAIPRVPQVLDELVQLGPPNVGNGRVAPEKVADLGEDALIVQVEGRVVLPLVI